MTQTLLLRLTPQNRLLLGTETTNSNFIDSTAYIPGSMVRGCMGAAMHQQLPADHDSAVCQDDGCLFCATFEEEAIRFGFAYYRALGQRTWPLPLTARSCKRYPGFSGQRPTDGHGVHDILLNELAWSLASDPRFFSKAVQLALTLDPTNVNWEHQRQAAIRQTETYTCGHDQCPHPLQPLPASLRYYSVRHTGQTPTITAAERPPIERRTHVGINRARMVAEDALLFTETALDVARGGGFEFVSTVTVPDELAAALNDCLPQETTIGRGRSRGYGDITVQLSADKNNTLPLKERVAALQTKLKAALQTYQSPLADTLPGHIVTLTLRSPAIFQEQSMAVRFPQPATVNLPPGSLPLRAWARTEVVGGWDQAIKMPRPTQLAVRAGSVFAYYIPSSVTEEDLYQPLTEIEQNGIGAERGSGYGEVTVCAPFHTQQARF